jgi:hypothetical protein
VGMRTKTLLIGILAFGTNESLKWSKPGEYFKAEPPNVLELLISEQHRALVPRALFSRSSCRTCVRFNDLLINKACTSFI